MSKTLVFSRNLLGFSVDESIPHTSTFMTESVAAPPPISRVVKKEIEKEPEPPAAPPPDLSLLRAEMLREEEPRIQQETEIRVRKEAEAAYQKQLNEELNQLKTSHQQVLDEEIKKRDAMVESLEQKLEQFTHDMKAEIAEQLVERSVEIAAMIVRHEMPDKTMLLRLIKETLAPVSDLQGAKIRISPDDLTLLKSEEHTPIAYDGQFEWVADNSLNSGDLIIESRNGIFDATLEQRLTLLEEQLQKQIRRK